MAIKEIIEETTFKVFGKREGTEEDTESKELDFETISITLNAIPDSNNLQDHCRFINQHANQTVMDCTHQT